MNQEMLRQSYISVVANASLTMYEQRVILQLVKWGQCRIDGLPLSVEHGVLSHNFNMVEITLNIADMLSEGSKHYEQVVNAAISLSRRRFRYQDARLNYVTTYWILRVTHVPSSGQLVLIIDKTFFDTLYNFRKGFCYYDMVRAMMLKHPQSVKLYQLVNNMKSQGITYEINQLKEMFGVSDKYGRNNDFVRKYLEVARQELEANGEGNFFRYSVIKDGRKIVQIHIMPIRRATSVEIQQAAAGIHKWMPLDFFRIMIQHAGFTNRQINANKPTLEKLVAHPLGMQILCDIISRCRRQRPNNPQGYIINAIKAEMRAAAPVLRRLK